MKNKRMDILYTIIAALSNGYTFGEFTVFPRINSFSSVVKRGTIPSQSNISKCV